MFRQSVKSGIQTSILGQAELHFLILFQTLMKDISNSKVENNTIFITKSDASE
jgi:hypothetical protein